MNKKSIITLSVVGLIIAGLSTPKLADAFWPFNQAKEESETSQINQAPERGKKYQNLTQEQIQEREEHRASHFEEKLQVLTDFFGIDLEEIRYRLDSGENPRDIAEDSDKTIEEWKEFRIDTKREHMREMGLSEEEIQSKLDWVGQKGQGKGRGMGQHFGK